MLFDQVFDLRPEVRVAFALHMAGSDDTVPPGSFGALHRSFLVVDQVVAKNFSFAGIDRFDLPPAMDNAFGLIEVRGLGDVIGNQRVILPPLRDTIHLDRQ